PLVTGVQTCALPIWALVSPDRGVCGLGGGSGGTAGGGEAETADPDPAVEWERPLRARRRVGLVPERRWFRCPGGCERGSLGLSRSEERRVGEECRRE